MFQTAQTDMVSKSAPTLKAEAHRRAILTTVLNNETTKTDAADGAERYDSENMSAKPDASGDGRR